MVATRTSPLLLAAVVLVASCTDGDDPPPQSTVVTTTTQAPVPRETDGVLRIGALLPVEDPRIGGSLTDALEATIADINAAGGVLDEEVELEIRDEGATAATASEAIAGLVEDGVDALIGPSSSLAALGALDDPIAAGLVTCSPTATAMALDDFPDDRLFFRTIASDSLQAVAIAEVADDTGERGVAVVYTDDAYGRPYAAAVDAALDDRALDVVELLGIPVGDEVDDVAAEVIGLDARVVIVLGAAGDSARFLDALGRLDFRDLTNVIVNDAIRDPLAREVIATLPSTLRSRIVGVAPQITVETDGPRAGPFAPQATDCLNLIALAAVQAGADTPEVIAGLMPSVSDGGQVCTSFADCLEDLERNREIDYNGPTGTTVLNREGETSRARFETFLFDDSGADVSDRFLLVPR